MDEVLDWDLGDLRGDPIGPVLAFDETQLHIDAIGEGSTVVFAHRRLQPTAPALRAGRGG